MSERKTSARVYKVLKHDAAYGWSPAAEIEASSAEQAIRLTASERGEGRYVAVPVSNWTEIGVRVEIPAPRIYLDTDSPAAVEDQPTEIIEPQSLNANGQDTLALPEDLTEEISAEEFEARRAEIAARRAQ